MAKDGTIRIKSDSERGFATINASDFDPKKHESLDPKENLPDASKKRLREMEEERLAQAAYGQVDGGAVNSTGRNPTGTFSEPTPSDVRYPNTDDTEFENNHGAFAGKSAAKLREEKDLPEQPGGIHPIPDDWESLPAKERSAIAEALTGEKMKAADADEAIRAELAEREEAGQPTPA